LIIQTLKTPVVVANLSPSNVLNTFRYYQGQLEVPLATFTFQGEDVESFLHSQSTFDVRGLVADAFHLISFLDPQGRLQSYGWLLKEKNRFNYLVPVGTEASTLERLEKFLISEDVDISKPEIRPWTFALGPLLKGSGLRGELFGEAAFLSRHPFQDLPVISPETAELWRGLSGWPSFSKEGLVLELLNNLRLFDLSLSPNKGCYPGQETVAKIATRRGAAYSSVLIEVDQLVSPGEIHSFNKLIGRVQKCHHWYNRFYLETQLLRDFRVEGLTFAFNKDGSEFEGKVHYFPLLPVTVRGKAEELFYQASDAFRMDDFDLAESLFRQSLLIDPTFADAYEGLGVMLGRQERFGEAVELMNQLSQVDSDSVLAHTNKSLYLMRLGKIQEAEDEKAQATLKSFKKFGEEAKLKEELEKEKIAKQSEWKKRESMFLQVLEIDPDDTLANYGIGSIAVEQAEWPRAISHLERVIAQDPKYSVAYLALGKAYRGQGEISLAKKTWEEGIKVAAAKGDLMPANQMHSELQQL
jgi:tetratricopeptide (TPR) repeat protein